jgi:hypothetical protein
MTATVVHQTVLVGRNGFVPLAGVGELLHLKGLLYKDVLNVVGQIVDLVFWHLELTVRCNKVAIQGETEVSYFCFVPQLKTGFADDLLRLLRILGEVIANGEGLLLTVLRLKASGEIAGVKRSEAMDRGDLLVDSFNIFFVLALGTEI